MVDTSGNTKNQMTLMSLFDGSGGFALGAKLCGIEPVAASEVEPFPIRVTTRRFPDMKHYGDINQINGAEIPPVDIITGGFCCQDLSVAGRRVGLHGERSGLFFQIVRIIKEMRKATENAYPKFAVLENVPGIYSSAQGQDFLEVLNELTHIKDETLSIPLPASGKWSTSACIVGDGFSLGWRTFDAQFWGVPQRRRRCYIVVDFTGDRAEKILFDESRLRGNPPQGIGTWQATAGDFAGGVGGAIAFEPGASSRLGGHVWDEHIGTLRAHAGDNQTTVAIPINEQVGLRPHKDGDGTGLGVGEDGDPAYTIQAHHPHAVAVENHPQDSRVKIQEDGIVQTLDVRMGMGGGNVPLVMNERQYALTIGEGVANTLTGTDYKGTQCVFEPKPAAFMGGQGAAAGSIAYSEEVAPTIRGQAGGNSVPMICEPKTLKIRSGCEGGGKGALLQDNLSATLSTVNDQTLFEPRLFGIDSSNSNSMKSGNPHSGCHKMDTSRTLDTGACTGNGGQVVVSFTQNQRCEVRDLHDCAEALAAQPGMKQQTYVAQETTVYTLEGNGQRPSHKGTGVSEGVIPTLNSVEQHQVAYAMTTGCYTQVGEEKAPTLQARDYKDAPIVARPHYIVRRLTPIECALLQGFPPDWCDGLATPEPTSEDIAFWSGVWETHRCIVSKSGKPKSEKQIVKWLKNPYTDGAAYRMWGNGVCLSNVHFVLSGIVYYTQ